MTLDTGGGIEPIIRNRAVAASAWFDSGASNTASAETLTEAVILKDDFEVATPTD